ncbi:MAG TPA: Ig-like domain-containing protein, partial [Candidatus Eisenbacteria bacterium]
MKTAVRLVALGMLISACFAGPAAAQYIKITTDNPTDNTRMRAAGTTILSITLDTNHDKDGSLQSCNSHSAANCGATSDPAALTIFSFQVYLSAVGGTVTWGTFTPDSSAYTTLQTQLQDTHDVEFTYQRQPAGSFTNPGLMSIGKIPVTITSGSPAITFPRYPNLPLDANSFGTAFGTACVATVFGNTYLLGDRADPCGTVSGIPTDWYDSDGALAPAGANTFPNITAPATASAVEGTLMAAITATATDADAADNLTITQSGKPADLSFTATPLGPSPRTATISGTPGFSDAGSYNIVWTVNDGAGGTATVSTALDIANTNQAPTLNQPANMTVDENATADQVLTGADADGDALTFAKVDGPTYMTVTTTNATAGNIHLAPGFSNSGTAPATVRASDGSLNTDKTLTITVNNVNRAPTLAAITDMTVTEGSTADQALTASDPDGTALTFTKATGPGFMTVTTTNATTGNVHLAPIAGDAAGSPYAASATASDGDMSNTKSFSITVNPGVPQNSAPTLSQPSNMTVDEGATADQVLTASDPDADALTFTKVAGPAFMTVTTTNATTGNVHLAPGFSDSGTHGATVRASDGSLSDDKSFTITVNNVNRPPALVQPSNMTVDENATADQVLTGSDPDADALTFTKVAGPAFMSVTTTNATTGNVHLAPGFSDSGTAPATVRASDGSLNSDKTLTITVNNVNRPPTLVQPANMTVTEGGTADQTLTGSDPDGDALTFTKATGPGFMTVATTIPLTGNVHLAPIAGDAAGSPYAASATASDATLSDTKSFSITVNPGVPQNSAPTLSQPTNMTVDEGAMADQVLTASDPDADALTFTKLAGPAFMTVTTTNATTGNIHLAPAFSDSGTFSAAVRASDGSLSDDKSLQIRVNNVNRPPTLVQPSNMTVTEGGTADQTLTGSDPDGDALTFTKATGPGFMTVTTATPTTGSVHLAPIAGDAAGSPYAASATASDGDLSDTKSFSITVNPEAPGNRPPTLTQPTNMTVDEGATADQVLTASDPDADALTFTKVAGPAFMNVSTTNATTGNVHLAPGFTDAGTQGATVRASDGSLSDDRSFTITVTNVNRPPTLAAITDMTVTEGATADQALSGSDPDGDALTFTKATGPGFMAVTTATPTTGSVHLAPIAGDAAGSPYAASATASDGDLSDTKSFSITVNPEAPGNRPPTLTQPTDMTVDEGATADQVLTASDPDENALTFTKVAGPGFMTVTTTNATTGNIHLAPGFSDAGIYPATTYPATVRASDGSLSDDKSLQITVNNVNRPPTLVQPTDMTATEGSTADQALTGFDPDAEALTFTKATGPGFMAVTTTTPTTGIVHLAPIAGDAAGSPYAASATASDGALSDTKSFTITVSPASVDHAPAVAAPSAINGEEGGVIAFSVSASDPDGDAIESFTAEFSLPEGNDASFTTDASKTTGNFVWHPKSGDAGSYSVTFTASNGLSGSATTQLGVDRAGTGVNGLFTWTPQAGSEGVYDVVFTATDAGGTSTFTSTITIVGGSASPRPAAALAPQAPLKGPIISGPSTVSGTTGTEVTVSVYATSDPTTGASAGSPRVRLISRAARAVQAIELTADLSNLPAGNNAQFNIIAGQANAAPTLTQPSNMTVDEGATADQVLSGSDPDGDALTYTKADGPGFMTVTTTNATTGNVHLAPGFSDAGVHGATVRASDGALSDEKSFQITVNNVEGAFEADVSVSDGDRVIRLATGRPFWCVQIEPVGGNFSINDIIPSSIVARFGGVEIPILAARKFGRKGKDHDRDIRSDGVQERERDLDGDGVRNGNNSREEGGDSAFQACFSKEGVRILFASLPDGRQTVEVTIAGNLTGGGAFEGTVSVIVVKGALGALAHANATPNPFNPQTVI